MGYLQQVQEVQPSTPAANNSVVYHDTNDNRRAKVIKDTGVIDVISPIDRYNYLINGGFDFVQRWSPSLSTNTQSNTNRVMNADRWGLTAQTNGCQYGRIDTSTAPLTGITARYYGKFVQITGAGKIAVSQVLETKDVMAMRGRTVRFQAKLRMPTNASNTALRMGLLQLTTAGTSDTMPTPFISNFSGNSADPLLGGNLAYINPVLTDGGILTGAAGVEAMNITPTSNFTRYSATFSVPTNCLNLVAMVWTDSQMSVNDELDITEAQLLMGQEINDWFPMSHEEELERVQRYCSKTFLIDTAPAQSVGTSTGELKFVAGKAGATAEFATWEFPVRMRTTPATITTYNPSASNAQVRDETVPGDCSATATTGSCDTYANVTATGNSSTAVGNVLGIHILADAEI